MISEVGTPMIWAGLGTVITLIVVFDLLAQIAKSQHKQPHYSLVMTLALVVVVTGSSVWLYLYLGLETAVAVAGTFLAKKLTTLGFV